MRVNVGGGSDGSAEGGRTGSANANANANGGNASRGNMQAGRGRGRRRVRCGYCKKCKGPKPARSHHCHVCDQCVLNVRERERDEEIRGEGRKIGINSYGRRESRPSIHHAEHRRCVKAVVNNKNLRGLRVF